MQLWHGLVRTDRWNTDQARSIGSVWPLAAPKETRTVSTNADASP